MAWQRSLITSFKRALKLCQSDNTTASILTFESGRRRVSLALHFLSRRGLFSHQIPPYPYNDPEEVVISEMLTGDFFLALRCHARAAGLHPVVQQGQPLPACG